jgi:hypothetical protein
MIDRQPVMEESVGVGQRPSRLRTGTRSRWNASRRDCSAARSLFEMWHGEFRHPRPVEIYDAQFSRSREDNFFLAFVTQTPSAQVADLGWHRVADSGARRNRPPTGVDPARASLDLLSDLESDTRNVLLTLARIWTTLELGRSSRRMRLRRGRSASFRPSINRSSLEPEPCT